MEIEIGSRLMWAIIVVALFGGLNIHFNRKCKGK